MTDEEIVDWLFSKSHLNGECIESHLATLDGEYTKVTKSYNHRKAHRLVFAVRKGPIPEGLWVLHTCDNKKCFNPDHLFLGTRRDNVDDMVNKGRHKAERPKMISEGEYKEMFELRNQGWSYNRLAAKYFVTKQTIYKYIKGQRGYA